MKPIQLFGQGTKSRSSNATSLTLVNMYLEQSDDKTSMVAYGTPGLTLFTSFGDTPVRGMYAIDDTTIYAVHRNTFYTINNAGVRTAKGNLNTSSGFVDISHNTTQIIVVDGTDGYIYTISSGAFAVIADADFPGADTVAFNNGRFIVNKPDTGQYWLSDAYDGTAWDAASFATAESSPDNLVRVAVDHGQLVLFGDKTIEFATDIGALDFPYARISGAGSEWGLAARWSVAKFGESLIFLAKNRMGEVQIAVLNGYAVQRVSTSDIENIINNYSTVTNATGLSYMYNGHPFYQINFPTESESWLFDGLSGHWSRLKYGQNDRHRAEIAVAYTNSIKVSDWESGNIYTVDGNAYTDNGAPIYAEITGKHVFNGLERMTVNALQVDCETGVGLATGADSDPQIMLQISKDGGNTLGVERWTDLGAIGAFKTRAIWRRLGVARDFVFRLRITANVKRVILGAWINAGG